MKVYYREVTSRESINPYGKLGFALYLEVVITDDIKKEIDAYYAQWGCK